MELLVAIAVFICVFAGLGSWITSQKRRSAVEGFIVGGLFGPLGCLIVALLPNGKPTANPIPARQRHRSGRWDYHEPSKSSEADEAVVSWLSE